MLSIRATCSVLSATSDWFIHSASIQTIRGRPCLGRRCRIAASKFTVTSTTLPFSKIDLGNDRSPQTYDRASYSWLESSSTSSSVHSIGAAKFLFGCNAISRMFSADFNGW
ncbi:hypothetical protein BDV36DRAFT_245620 [Aspergillus pseudocaelatus]|uniref:Uncharacterized protein n=1 Tax=Aspergillus pseudocaelatus TaxID=1825620 RepID=A0ABQ6X2N2_9EURO|nr:hypothetical protein BDV36DRAFT_245620 [Aspergillus pseudocaelatus]